jgi:YaiO family outer membrane protein
MMKKFILVAILFSCSHLSAQPPSFEVSGNFPDLYFNHTVAEGQSFSSLAKLYNLSPNIIASSNKLHLGADLPAGRVLKIPATTTNFRHFPGANSFNNYIPIYYLVRQNDLISLISKKYGISDTTIQRINVLGSRTVKTGDKLIVGYLKVRKDQPTPSRLPSQPDTIKPITGNAPSVPIGPDTTVVQVKELDSDKLFEQARRTAFDKKDYTTALQLCFQALRKSPDYSDIRVFAGRIYTWTDKLDSAITQFTYVVEHDRDNKEVYVAYSDLRYWNEQYSKALEVCDTGLSYYGTSKDLLIRKVKILRALKRPAEAQEVLEKLLKIDRTNTEARALLQRNKDEVLKNKIGVSYEYNYFDKQFSDPWHIGSLDYSRQTNLGSIGAHLNYANRFQTSGLQYEVDAYPHISKRFYSYISGAYSSNVGVFPKYRGGFSLYSILPQSFEGEVGIRYLYFSDATLIYTGAVSKYYKSWLFTARTYITPGEQSTSHTYNFTTRYYYGGADDYFLLTLGHGISPDESIAVLLNNKQFEKLVTVKATVGFRHEFKKKYLLTIDAGWMNQEYRPNTKGNQLLTGISYQVRF